MDFFRVQRKTPFLITNSFLSKSVDSLMLPTVTFTRHLLPHSLKKPSHATCIFRIPVAITSSLKNRSTATTPPGASCQWEAVRKGRRGRPVQRKKRPTEFHKMSGVEVSQATGPLPGISWVITHGSFNDQAMYKGPLSFKKEAGGLLLPRFRTPKLLPNANHSPDFSSAALQAFLAGRRTAFGRALAFPAAVRTAGRGGRKPRVLSHASNFLARDTR